MNPRTVTVTVPPALYEQLERQARSKSRSIEEEVVLTLAETLQGDSDPSADTEATLASLDALDDDLLRRLASSRVPDTDAERLAELGDKQQREGLTATERREAEDLVRQHDRVMLVRAEAAVLLKQRGHDLGDPPAQA
jgi:hypothetical protein